MSASDIPPKAAAQIADAAERRATDLLLDDHYGLQYIPPSLPPLSHLQKLSIARCKISSLQGIAALTGLRELSLAFNLIGGRSRLSDVRCHVSASSTTNQAQLCALTNLRALDLSHNPNLSSLPQALFASLVLLQSFSVTFTGLTSIPEGVASLAQLTNLDASCCKFTAVPAALYELTALQDLNLYYNRIEALPDRVPGRPRGLLSLRRLCLSNNRLKALPDDFFAGMTQLADFDCWENQLTALPPSIVDCVSLRSLLAASNAIATYPDGLSRLTSLQRLNFFSNKLTALPPLATLTNLISLSLRNNQIATLPAYIPPLPLLKETDLRDNPFADVPPAAAAELKGLLHSVPNEVFPHLYIGNKYGVENLVWLRNKKIALIVNMAAEIEPKYPTKYNYFCVPCMDKYDVTRHMVGTFHLIDSYTSRNLNVIVHCAQGRSRSGSIVVGYLMQKLRVHYEQALEVARKGRPMIQPNFGFVRQLRAWGSANGLPSPPPPAAPEKKAEETATKQAES